MLSHVEIVRAHLCYDDFDFKTAGKDFGLAKLHNSFLQVVVARQSSHNHINMFVILNELLRIRVKLINELNSVVLHRFLNRRHLEIVGSQLLIAEISLHGICESSLSTAWDACNKDY